jgi:PPOX class probable F420-dependent enzyme
VKRTERAVTRDEAIARAAQARVGHLATVRPDGTPHVVPFVFALVVARDGDVTVYWAVDRKPKRSTELRRIQNLRANPSAEVVVDGYADDWTSLWWVRMRGRGRVFDADEERRAAIEALARKYEQYRSARPDGDVVAIDVDHVAWWSASGGNRR